jgi:hypothetical protein
MAIERSATMNRFLFKLRWCHLLALAAAALLAAPIYAHELERFPGRDSRQLQMFPMAGLERGGGAPGPTAHSAGDVSLGIGAGLTFDPTAFLATGEVDFWLQRFLSVGPLVQFAAGDGMIFAASGGPKLTFDFEDNEFSDLVKPYWQAGLGVAVVGRERGPRHDRRFRTEAGLLLLFGLGVDFYLSEELSLGTGLLFNILPTKPSGESFYLGWKLIEVGFHF